ncbi:MAG: protein kinase [Gemmatimonadales bacterium]
MTTPSNDFTALQAAVAGRFSLDRELGRGGMGVVYLARDVALDRPVAIKLLPSHLAALPDSRERFLREARTAAGLSHPNVVPIYLVEANDAAVWFVMGYVEGESLGDRVRRQGPLPVHEAVRVTREVAWALAYAHGRGVIHRDIKPDNILLERGSGRAMVTDFGIARVVSRSTLSQQGEIVGTLQYMSPEQVDPSATLDGRSDLYALGVTAFYALTGRLPFDSENATALLAMHLTEPAPPITSVRPTIPAKVAEAVDRCLAKAPDARFPSAEALADALGDSVPANNPIPPSAMHLRDAVNVSFTLLYFPLGAWFMTSVFAPDSAAVVGWIALAFAILGLMNPFYAARECVRAGLNPKEIANIFASQAAVSDATLEISGREVYRLRRWVRSPIGRIICGLVGIGALGFAIHAGSRIVRPRAGDDGFEIIPAAILALGTAIVYLGAALKTGPIGRWLDADLASGTNPVLRQRQRMARWLYDNPLMRLAFRLARFTVRAPKPAPVIETAPTEVLLGHAANELFTALPKADRVRMTEIPEVIRGLERAAQVLRGRRDELARTIAEAGEAGDSGRRAELVRELETARGMAEQRLRTAVMALENLRLDLLRARAGVGRPDQLTAALEDAKRVGEEINAELAGRQEVDRVLRA